jgi:anti-anti-sigma factor
MQNTPIFSHQIIGDFTSQKAIEVKNILMDLVKNGHINLVIDFTKASEVDVVGINTLANLYKQIRRVKGTIIIHLNKDSHLAKMLHLTKFEQNFTLVYP